MLSDMVGSSFHMRNTTSGGRTARPATAIQPSPDVTCPATATIRRSQAVANAAFVYVSFVT